MRLFFFHSLLIRIGYIFTYNTIYLIPLMHIITDANAHIIQIRASEQQVTKVVICKRNVEMACMLIVMAAAIS